LFTTPALCSNILGHTQYETVKRLNEQFFEQYKKLDVIHLNLIKLSSYDTGHKYKDTLLSEAIEHITFTINHWEYEYRLIKLLPAIRDDFLNEFLRKEIKSIELLKKKTLMIFANPLNGAIIQLEQAKRSNSINTDILKELKNAKLTIEEGTNLLEKIAKQLKTNL
jgi:hypothetical protein